MKKDVEIEDIQSKIQPNIYDEFKNDLSEESIERLRKIGFQEKDDSVFVLAIVRGLYHDRLGDLSKKSITGRSKGVERKEPISPAKMSVIDKMFEKRMKRDGSSAKTSGRKNKVNKHIKTAIQNINKIGH